jgi:predicted dinucleotide-binding enzyme
MASRGSPRAALLVGVGALGCQLATALVRGGLSSVVADRDRRVAESAAAGALRRAGCRSATLKAIAAAEHHARSTGVRIEPLAVEFTAGVRAAGRASDLI